MNRSDGTMNAKAKKHFEEMVRLRQQIIADKDQYSHLKITVRPNELLDGLFMLAAEAFVDAILEDPGGELSKLLCPSGSVDPE